MGQAADRRRRRRPRTTPGSWPSASPTPPTARASTASTWQTGAEGDVPRYPTPDELWNADLRRSRTPGATASPPCRSRTRAATWQGRYYQDIAIERVLEAIAAGQAAHPAHAGHRHRQDLHRLPDRLEAVPEPLEPDAASRRAGRASCSSPTATSWPTRPTTPSRPSPRTRWCASTRTTSARRARCRRTAASSSRSFRPS